MTLADRLAKHREVAEAAYIAGDRTLGRWSMGGYALSFDDGTIPPNSPIDPDSLHVAAERGGAFIAKSPYEGVNRHIAANSPEVTLAFIALAEADDPEPDYHRDSGAMDFDTTEDTLHIAWRKRQELRANIDRVLGGGE
jgi:hypothetical protein